LNTTLAVSYRKERIVFIRYKKPQHVFDLPSKCTDKMKNCFSCKSTFEKEGCKDINDHSSCVKNYYRYKAAVKLKPEKKKMC